MSSPVAPATESVEAFAELCAALDHPFSDRAAVLAAARLDERVLLQVQEQWGTRLGADPQGAGARFVQAYEGARQRRGTIGNGADAPVGARPAEMRAADRASAERAPPAAGDLGAHPKELLSPPAVAVPSFMKQAAPELPTAPAGAVPVAIPAPSPLVVAAQREPLPTETGAVDLSELLKPAVPFAAGGPSKMAVATVQEGLGEKAPRHEATETVEFDITALLKNRVPVPFQPPAPRPKTLPLPVDGRPEAPTSPPARQASPPRESGTSDSTGKRRRLIRFDPQTGTPLATPYWQDLPETDEKKE